MKWTYIKELDFRTSQPLTDYFDEIDDDKWYRFQNHLLKGSYIKLLNKIYGFEKENKKCN